MNFNYGEVLSKAWKIIWKYKVLWIFGILASCGRNGGGNGGGNGGSSGSGGSGSGSGDGITLPPEMQSAFNNIERYFENMEPWMAVLLVIGGVLFILAMIFLTNYVSTIGRIGLVNGTVKGDQDVERLTFAELLQTGGPLFWRVFWLNLLAGLVVGILIVVTLLPMIGLSIITFGIGLLCLLPFICLLVPISWVISIWLEQANISMIIEQSSIGDALRKAWEVMKQNLAIYIVMALILGVIGVVIGLVTFLPVITVMMPVIVGIAAGGEQAMTMGLIVTGVCCVILFPFLLAIGGIASAYTTSSWTLTYLRLTRLAPAAPKPYLAEEVNQDLV